MNSAKEHTRLPAAELIAGPWRAVFYKQQDRFAHTLLLEDDDRGTILRWDSVEGSATEDWPPSPPLQQLHQQSAGSGQVLYLVGMAGRSHWSVSCTADPIQGRLEFDVACRTRMLPEQIGTRYQLAGQTGWQSLAADPHGLGLPGTPRRIELPFGDIEIAGGEAHIRPRLDSPGFPHTFRWKYIFM